MIDYRAYIVGNDGHFETFEVVTADCDDSAVKAAKKLVDQGKRVDFKELLKKDANKGTTYIRDLTIQHWKPWIGVEHRCIAPMSSFSEFNEDTGSDIWFALEESRPLVCFAGM